MSPTIHAFTPHEGPIFSLPTNKGKFQSLIPLSRLGQGGGHCASEINSLKFLLNMIIEIQFLIQIALEK